LKDPERTKDPKGGVLSLSLNSKIVRQKIQVFVLLGTMKMATLSLILNEKRQLALKPSNFINLNEEPISMKTSPNGELVLTSMMDNSLHIRYADSLKMYLKIYGHSLPITDFACSSDEYILATISSDKSLRIWDKDFGNCRRIINKCHDVCPLQINIIKDTHYALTTGRDHFVKFWDLDTFEVVMRFECLGQGALFSLGVSSIGHFFVTGSIGKSMRKFRQTREQVLAKDTQQEIQDETGVLEEFQERDRKQKYFSQDAGVMGGNRATRLKKFDILKGAEELMDLLETIDKECLPEFTEFENSVLDKVKTNTSSKPKMFLGKREMLEQDLPEYPRKDTVAMMNPALYVLGQLAKLKRDSLTQLLRFLHFRHIKSILNFVRWGLDNGVHQELCLCVLRVFGESLHSQVFLHAETRRNIEMICSKAGHLLKQQRELAMTNRAALQLMLKELSFLKEN
jgi:hypothetical protein